MPAPSTPPPIAARFGAAWIPVVALLLALWSTWPIGGGALGLGPLLLPHDPAYGPSERAPVHGALALLATPSGRASSGPSPWRSERLAAPFGQELLWRDHQHLPRLLLGPAVDRLGAERAFGLGLLLSAWAAAAGALCLARRLGLAAPAALFLALAAVATPAAVRGGLASLARGPDPWLPWLLLCGLAGATPLLRPWLQGALLAGAWLTGWGFGLVASLALWAQSLLPGPAGLPGREPGPRLFSLAGALLLASVLGWPFWGALRQSRELPAPAPWTAAAAPAPGAEGGPGAERPSPPPARAGAAHSSGSGWLERLQAAELSPLRRARGQGVAPHVPAPGRAPPGAPQWPWVLLLGAAVGALTRPLGRWAAALLGLALTALFGLWLAARSLRGFALPFDPLHPWAALEALLRGAAPGSASALAALDGGALDQGLLFLAALAGAAAVDHGLRRGPQARLLAGAAPLLLALELWALPLPSFRPAPARAPTALAAPPGAVLHLPVEPKTGPIEVELARAGAPQTLPLFLDACAPELLRLRAAAPALLAWIASGRYADPDSVALELDVLEIGRIWLDLEAVPRAWGAVFVEAADRLPGWVREADFRGFARWQRARAFFDPGPVSSAER